MIASFLNNPISQTPNFFEVLNFPKTIFYLFDLVSSREVKPLSEIVRFGKGLSKIVKVI